MNRYTLKQNEAFYSIHTKTSSAVGMTPFYGGWNTLYNKLKVFKNGFVGDFTEFDSSLSKTLLKSQARNRWKGLVATNGWAIHSAEYKMHAKRYTKLVNEEINSLMKMA